jgi:5'-3' exonuclease
MFLNSWNWYFLHHYASMASDLINLKQHQLAFDYGNLFLNVP